MKNSLLGKMANGEGMRMRLTMEEENDGTHKKRDFWVNVKNVYGN